MGVTREAIQMVKVGLFVRLSAKRGKEAEVEQFLESGRSLGALVAALFLALCAFFSTGCSSSSTPTGETDSGTPPAATGRVTDTGGGTETGPTCNGTPTTHDVQVGGTTYTFTPSALTICKGDTVHWVWMGGPHTV